MTALEDLKTCLDLVKNDAAKIDVWLQVYSILQKHTSQNANLVNEKAGRNYTLLHFAGAAGNDLACRSLVENFGADPSVRTGRGESPAELARRRGHEALALQLSAYEDSHKDKLQAQTEARTKSAEERDGPPQAIQDLEAALELLKAEGGKDEPWQGAFTAIQEHSRGFPNLVNERAGRNYALLHVAAMHGNAYACRTLLEKYRADVILRTASGETASELALRKGHPELGKELKLQEANTEEELKRHLGVVKKEGDKNEVWEPVYDFLRESKVANNLAGLNYGFLHHAASWGNTVACRKLIDTCGADPFLRTPKKREMPEDIARKNDHSWTERILNSYAQGEARTWVGSGSYKRARVDAEGLSA